MGQSETMSRHIKIKIKWNKLINPLVSLRMSPASIASACSFHSEKNTLPVRSPTRHFRTVLPSLVWLVVPTGKRKTTLT